VISELYKHQPGCNSDVKILHFGIGALSLSSILIQPSLLPIMLLKNLSLLSCE
jgi:hypothetical protein